MTASPLRLDSLLRASPRQVSAPVDDEVALLQVDEGAYYGLNSTGARIWQLLQAPHTVAEIRDVICAEYDVDTATAETDVLELLQHLLDAGFIELENPDTDSEKENGA